MSALHLNENRSSASPSSKAPIISHPQDFRVLGRCSDHDPLASAHDLNASTSGQSGSGLVRPLARSQTASSPLGTRPAKRILQSSSSSALVSTTRCKGGSPIRKTVSSTNKLSRSVTSLLGSGALVQNKSSNVTGTDDSCSRSRITRSKTKNVFAKFAGVLSDTFTTKGNRKEDKSYDATNETTSVGDVKPAQIIDGLPLPRLALAPLPLINRGISSSRHPSVCEDINFETIKATRMTGRVGRFGRTPAVARKRLTIVDEVTFQEDSTADDPFSDSASRHNSPGSDAKLNHGDDKALNLPDPFEAERLLETNMDAILNTPPVGFSTPRRRSRSSWIRCPTPTRGPKAPSFDGSDLITFSDAGSPVQSDRRCKIPVMRGSPVRKLAYEETADLESLQQGGRGFCDGGRESSDSTRLSSYPPGSTIRHVPRSMGRLTDVPVLSAPDVQQSRAFPIARKKHPSPSKVQLEMYGKFMDNNLALGVFHDPDELGLSFEAPPTSSAMLSPRDANRLIRGSGATESNIDLVKDFDGHGSRLTSMNTRSRIPQPVKKMTRSRTETTLAKDFYPANAGDMSTEDELQWDLSAYKLGHRCNHCGSMNKQ